MKVWMLCLDTIDSEEYREIVCIDKTDFEDALIKAKFRCEHIIKTFEYIEWDTYDGDGFPMNCYSPLPAIYPDKTIQKHLLDPKPPQY